MTYGLGVPGAGLANRAASTGTFACTPLSLMVICTYVWLAVQVKGILTPATSRWSA